jgi:hypothetical protein
MRFDQPETGLSATAFCPVASVSAAREAAPGGRFAQALAGVVLLLAPARTGAAQVEASKAGAARRMAAT